MNFDYDVVLEKHYNEIFHYVYKQVNNIEDAKDITQDIFFRVYEKQDTYNMEKASIRTWIYSIAHHITINRLKLYNNKNKIDIDNWIFDTTASNEDVLESLIQKESVAEIICLMNRLLNKKHLRIMNLYFFSSLSITEISKSLNLPKQTVSNAIQRSIQKIQNKLKVKNNG